MNLKEYPAAIAKAAEQVRYWDSEIAECKLIIEQVESRVDREIAFDATLKNDAQRKSSRLELLELDNRYPLAIKLLREVTTERQAAATSLERLRNEFAVCKLEVQMVIADLMASTSA